MKNNRILVILIVFLTAIITYMLVPSISNYIENYNLNYDKKVYVGGDNIILDYVTNSSSDAISSSKEFATVGTITYIDLDSNYGAIAHEITDDNLETGNIFIVPVVSVVKSSSKRIGEKDVILNFNKSNGTINNAESTGVYGRFTDSINNKELFSVAMPKEIEIGDALLYTNIDGTEVKGYKVKIEKVYLTRKTHNIYVKIVDEELISKTGGIIQGMSGSPIVQNGKIIGALSHVDNNPLYGYGLLITYMI